MKDINELKKKLFEAIDTICKDYEPKPEYIKGKWYIVHCSGFIYIARFVNEVTDGYYCDIFGRLDGAYHQEVMGLFDKIERPATPAEIEAHLKKICDEKYIGKRVKSLYGDQSDTIQRFQTFKFDDILSTDKSISPCASTQQ